MNKFLLAISFLFLVSCQYFNTTVPEEDQLLEKELEKIDWNEVDEYPTMTICDSLSDKESQKLCFFETLIENIQSRIGMDSLKILYPKMDTLTLKVRINPDSSVEFKSKTPKDTISYDRKVVDSIIKKKLLNFPKVEPAIKQGIKVKSEFVVPIVI